jgi:hypothetical protein
MKFSRNYTINGVIAPIIGIFFLLGAIFALPSTQDQLPNRLALILGVFALIFSLPQLVNERKPTSSVPTVAETLISIIIVATISYAASSIVSSVVKKEPWVWIDLAVFLFIIAVIIYFLERYPPDITIWLAPFIVVGLAYGLIVRVLKSKLSKERIDKIAKQWFGSRTYST